MLNYKKLMAHEPFSYGTIENKEGQTIEFYEDPISGDMTEVICVCHDLELAAYSTFFETGDMEASHGEYEPSFKDGKLWIGDFEA